MDKRHEQSIFFLKKEETGKWMFNPLVTMEKQIKAMIKHHFPSLDWQDNFKWFGGCEWTGILNTANS